MTPRCRPGDLAVVVRSNIPANIGRFVRVIRPFRVPPDAPVRSAGCFWVIEAAHPLTWSANGRLHQQKQGPAPDEALQPIRGIPQTDLRRQCRPVD